MSRTAEQKSEIFQRQADILDSKKTDVPITIVGAGAIGGFAALTLAKMGFDNIRVYDFDTVEIHNIPNQFYRMSDIGRPKVEALQEIVESFTEVKINARPVKFAGKAMTPILVLAPDNMTTRIKAWTDNSDNDKVKLFVDARMSAEYLRMYAIDMANKDAKTHYEQSLYSDEEAVAERCTAKTIMYTVLGASAHIGCSIKKFIMGEELTQGLSLSFPANFMTEV